MPNATQNPAQASKNAAVIATHFHGAPAAFGLAPLLLLAVPAARDVLLRNQKLIITPTLALFFCFFAIQVVGALLAVKPWIASDELMIWVVEGLLVYLLVTNTVRTPRQLRLAIWGLLAAGAFIGGISGFQQITGSFENNYGGFAQVSDDSFRLQIRLEGPVGEKNRYAQIMAVLLPLALFIWRIAYFPLMVFSGHVASIGEWLQLLLGLPIWIYGVFLCAIATLHAVAAFSSAQLLRPFHAGSWDWEEVSATVAAPPHGCREPLDRRPSQWQQRSCGRL